MPEKKLLKLGFTQRFPFIMSYYKDVNGLDIIHVKMDHFIQYNEIIEDYNSAPALFAIKVEKFFLSKEGIKNEKKLFVNIDNAINYITSS